MDPWSLSHKAIEAALTGGVSMLTLLLGWFAGTRISSKALHTVVNLAAVVTLLFAAHAAVAQAAGSNVTGGCEIRLSERTAENGCYLLATELFETLPAGPVFWHLYTYPTRAAAEAAGKGSAGTVVESLGKVWLFAIAGSNWQPPAGERVAVIGPLPVAPAKTYTARYMEAVFPPR